MCIERVYIIFQHQNSFRFKRGLGILLGKEEIALHIRNYLFLSVSNLLSSVLANEHKWSWMMWKIHTQKNGRQSGDFLCVLKFYSTSFSGWSYKEIQIDYVQMLPSSGLQLHYSIYFYKYFQHTFILKLMTRIFINASIVDNFRYIYKDLIGASNYVRIKYQPNVP